MKELPKEITVCKLDCILMPQGEVLCLGKTVGWFKDLKPYLEKADAPETLRQRDELLEACKIAILALTHTPINPDDITLYNKLSQIAR